MIDLLNVDRHHLTVHPVLSCHPHLIFSTSSIEVNRLGSRVLKIRGGLVMGLSPIIWSTCS